MKNIERVQAISNMVMEYFNESTKEELLLYALTSLAPIVSTVIDSFVEEGKIKLC